MKYNAVCFIYYSGTVSASSAGTSSAPNTPPANRAIMSSPFSVLQGRPEHAFAHIHPQPPQVCSMLYFLFSYPRISNTLHKYIIQVDPDPLIIIIIIIVITIIVITRLIHSFIDWHTTHLFSHSPTHSFIHSLTLSLSRSSGWSGVVF